METRESIGLQSRSDRTKSHGGAHCFHMFQKHSVESVFDGEVAGKRGGARGRRGLMVQTELLQFQNLKNKC